MFAPLTLRLHVTSFRFPLENFGNHLFQSILLTLFLRYSRSLRWGSFSSWDVCWLFENSMILAVNKCEFSSISNQPIRIYQLPDHKPGGDVFEVDGVMVFNGRCRTYDNANYSSNASFARSNHIQCCARQKWADHKKNKPARKKSKYNARWKGKRNEAILFIA